MNILEIAGIVIFVGWAYVLFIRPQLIKSFPNTFGKFVAAEGVLFAKSRTILIARIYSIGGIILAIHGFVLTSGTDTTAFVTELGKLIPEQYRALALSGFLFATGLGFEWLRRVTTGGVGTSANPEGAK